jgi:exosome complex protein LRP1
MSTVEDPTALLDRFGSSFRELESLLHSSLLSKPLAETLEECESDLDKATTQVTLAYIVYDLVWIYLRTRGQDPMQHSVINELVRRSTHAGLL